MGDMFRSEKMALCQLFIQPEAAYASIAELGEKGCVQFRDLNEEVSAFQRKYVNEVRRCDDMERRLRYVESEMKKDEVKLPVLRPEEEPSAPNPREIVDLEAQLEKTDNELREMSANGASLDANFRHMQELKYVLESTEGFFSDQEVINLDVNRKLDPEDPANLPGAAQRGQLAFVAGVIKLERFFSFERITNKFTNGFQNLVDSYGMASYREVNPALYACITFPFLFAVMFGDLGHGLILLLFASWLIIKEKQLSSIKEEIFNIFFGGRYIIFLMGIFSIYTGFIYNDVFSKSMNIFGSAWHMNYTRDVVQDENLKYITLRPNDTVYKTYPFGMDPIWQLADNKIIFLNTFKMKLSIIVGVIHMIFGVSMSVVNFAYYKKYASIFLEFLPQVLFLLLLFGYMVFMMFFKWVVYNDTVEGPLSPACAPSILILFINMILQGSQDTPEPCKEFMFEGQKNIQQVFVIIAIICIPWMLLGKPLYIMIKRKTSGAPPPKPQSGGGEGHGEDDEMGEIFIHQAIHTIEYVLSTVSHTASYLRLWALSLAHAQLSEVLWNMVFSMGFQYDSYIGGILIYVFFGAWALLTVGILVLIEGLSAFLHTLRLHWVEFMSKFYEGAGYAFEPFAFKTILDVSEDD
ncbi:GD23787 [Drosophila simulans]|uniref:V-type proton ATPase subunit a n=1 Tax=Drosophila simulans TaxID=7240 RepID=B4Q391_DROSI|nr:GD23787 [Drosophila simulans]